jgi:hypothetical protein
MYTCLYIIIISMSEINIVSNTGNFKNFFKSWIEIPEKNIIYSLNRNSKYVCFFLTSFVKVVPVQGSMIIYSIILYAMNGIINSLFIYFESWLCSNFCLSSNSLVLFLYSYAICCYTIQIAVYYYIIYVHIYIYTQQ